MHAGYNNCKNMTLWWSTDQTSNTTMPMHCPDGPVYCSRVDTVIDWSLENLLPQNCPAQQNCASCEVPLPVSVARLQVDSVSQPQGQHPETVNLQTAQQLDPDMQTLLTWLEKGIRPPWTIVAPLSEIVKCYWAQWDSIRLKDGIIYRLWESPVGDRVVWQIVLPKMLQREVFQQLHSSPTAGHLGITKTLSRVRERFYWARNHRDIQDWCRSCDLCASKKGPQRRSRAPMSQYNVGAPMERLALDVLGPLPITDNGNKYLLIVADYFTKWPEAYPLPNQEATTVANVRVKEFICRFGVPMEIQL